MGRNTGGNPGDVRKSALWGSGNRGGEHRSNALWGKGGRGFVMTVLVVALAVPLAAGAGSGPGKNEGVVPPGGTYVSAELKEMQRAHPNELVDVIVMADEGVSDKDAKKAEQELRKLERRFDLIKGFSGEIRAKDLEKLERIQGPQRHRECSDAGSGLCSRFRPARRPDVEPALDVRDWCQQALGRRQAGDDRDRRLRHRRLARPTSRDASRRRSASSLGVPRTRPATGAATARSSRASRPVTRPGYAGAAPNADIVSLDVMDDSGAGKTSDVIAAAEWIYQNKAAYNIRVANFSLHSGAVNHFWLDPLNMAVEKLWLSGVVVVAAAGNYGSANGPSGVGTPPVATRS